MTVERSATAVVPENLSFLIQASFPKMERAPTEGSIFHTHSPGEKFLPPRGEGNTRESPLTRAALIDDNYP